MISVHHTLCNVVLYEVLQICSMWQNLKVVQKNVCIQTHARNHVLPVYASGLFSLKFHFMDSVVVWTSRSIGIFAMGASSYEQFKTTNRTAHCQKFK